MPTWQNPEQNAEDIQLLKKAQDGDADAFGQLYERYVTIIFRYTYAHIGDRMDAEDLTEEIFMRVWRTLSKYREQGVPFIAYLFRVGRNALIDHYRRSKRSDQPMLLEEDVITDTRPDPSAEVQANIERQEVRELMGQLREDYREVLYYRFLAELSPEETAQVMGKSAGAVRVLQHRALAALRELFESLKGSSDGTKSGRDR